MLRQCSIRLLRSCLQTLSPTPPSTAGQRCSNKADGSDNNVQASTACVGLDSLDMAALSSFRLGPDRRGGLNKFGPGSDQLEPPRHGRVTSTSQA
eukprot:1025190-Rhodomonas_salina.1